MIEINFNWKITLFSAVFLTIFLSLGFWQLDRAVAKKQLLATMAERQDAPGVNIGDLAEKTPIDGEPVQLAGRYDEKLRLLLDNRVVDGRVGYELMVPFEDHSGVVALVNLGHVPMTSLDRARLPVLPELPTEEIKIRGHVYINQLPVPSQNVSGAGPIYIVQVAEPQVLETVIGRPLFQHVIHLEAADPNALPRYWPVTTMLPEKHYGYAVTWFAMALAVSIAFLVFTFRRVHDRSN